jgi:1-pyrroline-5-carboxylate dehydrogenase
MGLIPYKNEAYLDWSDEKNVLAMQAALKDVGSRLDLGYPAIIGGKRIETDGEIVSVNPANPSRRGAAPPPKRGRGSFFGRRRS